MLRPVLLILAIGLLGAGCTTKRVTFPGRDARQVWTALVAVAKTPEYDDPDPAQRWRVKENQVFVDEEIAVIEIYRELDRIRYPARLRPQRQERAWRFRILFDDTEPPAAQFVSRGLGVPMHASSEARRYFDDVRELLESGAAPELRLPPAPIIDIPDPIDVEPMDAPPAVPDEPPPVGGDLLDPGR